MTNRTIRLDVGTLLCDTDFRLRPDTNRWSHRDGRPFTKAEQALAFSATGEEFGLAADQINREVAYHREYEEAVETLPKLLLPYLAQLPEGATVSDVLPLMSDQDRTAYDRLRDILAPDGYLFASVDE